MMVRKIIYTWTQQEKEKLVFSNAYQGVIWMFQMEEDDTHMQKSVCMQMGLQLHEIYLGCIVILHMRKWIVHI